jgi:hypothetical protein
MRSLLLIFVVASTALFALVGTGAADPNLVNAPPHQHFLVKDGVWTPIGPQVCPAGTNPQLQQAFNQFHFNIHHSELPGVGGIDTLGPQDGAPGLHNDIQADMEGRPCSFVPPSAP